MADLGTIGYKAQTAAKASAPITAFPLALAARAKGVIASFTYAAFPTFMTVLSPMLGVGPRDGTISNETISGTVRDDNGLLAIRRLRVYERASGRFVGEVWSKADGTYSLRVFNHVEHDVLCFDDAAGLSYNDLILRVAPAP